MRGARACPAAARVAPFTGAAEISRFRRPLCQVLDWGFTELIPLATLHSPSHGYILDDTLQFTIQFERVAEDGSGRSSSTRPRTGQTQTLNPALNLVPHP